MQLSYIVQKYLKKQNLTTWNIELGEDKLFNNIIVIPAINEFKNIPNLIESLSKNSKMHLSETLILFIVNNCISADFSIKQENTKSINLLRNFIINNAFGLNIGLIDACKNNKAIPDKICGVGFARKIGLDLSLNYFDYSNNRKKILISLDADCIVSDKYLEKIVEDFNRLNLHTGVVNYNHSVPEDTERKAAIINYEIFLRYYVLGLQYANSHFAYHSIGSTIVCDAESYVKVGGMNKRKAGEDFYFLEKLAKIDKIYKVADATVFPSARESDRVPFGTGQRIKRFLGNYQNEYLLYSPKSFEILRKWLLIFDNEIRSVNFTENLTNYLMQKAKLVNPFLFDFLNEQGFKKDWNNILSNSNSYEQLQKQQINWMDGFRTLKLIHYLRDYAYPNINMFNAVKELFDLMKKKIPFNTNDTIPSIKIQLEFLNFLRKMDK